MADFERVLNALNDVSQQLESMGSYLYGCISTDSRNELAKPDSANCRSALSRSTSCRHASPRGWELCPLKELSERSTLPAEHEFPLRQLHVAARHLMSEEAEALAAELSPSSGAAWAKLHDNLTSQITAKVELDGRA